MQPGLAQGMTSPVHLVATLGAELWLYNKNAANTEVSIAS